MKIIKFFSLACLSLLFFSCNDQPIELDSPDQSSINPRFKSIPLNKVSLDLSNDNSLAYKNSSSQEERWMNAINAELAEQGAPVQISAIESYNIDGSGNTVFFKNNGNKQLGADFVPGDQRRGGFSDIAFARDGTEGFTSSGLMQGDTDGAILSAMNTWNSVTCSSGLELTSLGASSFDLGYVQALVGLGGSFSFTDVMHSGFNRVIDAVYGSGSNVLGVTFTFVWLDGGLPTDIDNNGKQDVAFRDIYYNDAFSWSIGSGGIDVETVVLHEAGHGLSQGHFGKLSQTDRNGKYHFAPRAVMNAGYTGIQTMIEKTDKAGHCSNWAEWPNN